MESAKAALMSIKADPSRAEEELERGYQNDRRGFVTGLAAFVVAALQGWVIDPDDL